MKRSAPLKRTPFKRSHGINRPQREEKPRAERIADQARKPTVRTLHSATMAAVTSAAPVPKKPMLQHAGYMAAVRDLGYCMRCRLACRPDFCHADEGKGMGIKTDVRRGWPGCRECHNLIGSTGAFPREEKRALEAEYGRRTRDAVRAAGTWPARCPEYTEKAREAA